MINWGIPGAISLLGGIFLGWIFGNSPDSPLRFWAAKPVKPEVGRVVTQSVAGKELPRTEGHAGREFPSVQTAPEFVPMPKALWKRPFLRVLKSNFELTREAREFFGLSEEKEAELNDAIAEFEEYLKNQESEGAEGFVTDQGSVVFKIAAWNDDYAAVRDVYVDKLSGAFGSAELAEFFAGQSENSFAAPYGALGTEPRFMQIIGPNEEGRYLSKVFSGGNVGEIDLADFEGKQPSSMKYKGVKMRVEHFKEIPAHLSHLLKSPKE